MTTITRDAAIEAMRELAAGSPDRVNDFCMYVEPVDHTRSELLGKEPHCLIGHVLIKRFGIPLDVFDPSTNGACINSTQLLERLSSHGFVVDAQAAAVMRAVQEYLDDREVDEYDTTITTRAHTWGEGIDVLDHLLAAETWSHDDKVFDKWLPSR